MSESIILPKYSGGDIVTFCREEIAIPVYGKRKRQGKKPDQRVRYAIDHAEHVANLGEEVLLSDSDYRPAALAAAWLHDIAEENRDREGFNIDVFNPYSPKQRFIARGERKKGVQFINDALSTAGSEGRHVCYIVDRLTYREEIGRYEGYRKAIYKLKEDPVLVNFLIELFGHCDPKILQILSTCLKTFDQDGNTDVEEERDIEPLMAEYHQKKNRSERALRHFYHVCGVENTFRARDDFSYNEDAFSDAILKKWISKKIRNAQYNLEYFLPDAEDTLLIFMPDDSDLFDKEKMRSVIEGIYIKSLQILKDSNFPEEYDLYVIKKIGNNRGRQRPEETILDNLIKKRVGEERKAARAAKRE